MKLKLIFFLLSLGFLTPLFQVSAGTVLSSSKYAWSNNAGYINFANVIVDDNTLSGYAWSINDGWIKFNPAKGGVLNDGAGHLSGSAWGEGLGWIDFSNVSINTATGKFSGTASGDLVGTITFDCPNYCDVRTDWRPIVLTSSSGGFAGNGSANFIPGTSVPQQLQAINVPLTILPAQAGTLTQDTAAGKIIVEVPAGSLFSKVTLSVTAEALAAANNYLVAANQQLINGVFYNISAKDLSGNLVKLFKTSLTIALPIPQNIQGDGNLAVYWLNETNQQWVLVPEAIFAKNKVTFQVNHLTKFAIFEVALQSRVGFPSFGQKPSPANKLPPSLVLPVIKKPAAQKPIIVLPQKLNQSTVQKVRNFIKTQETDISKTKILTPVVGNNVWNKVISTFLLIISYPLRLF